MLPVKGGPSAKTRLRRDLDRTAMAAAWAGTEVGYAGGSGLSVALGAAIAMDTVAAAAACPVVSQVVVVSADAAVRQWAGASARVVAESAPGAGLLAAVADGLAAAGPSPVAVLLGDLPAMRPDDLTEVLAAAQELLTGPDAPPMVALGDADGEGTVMVAARRPVDVAAAFGPDSLRLHRRRGALTLDGAFERLRRDVDTVADLHHAAALGLGRHTAAVLAGTGSWLTGEEDELPASQAC